MPNAQESIKNSEGVAIGKSYSGALYSLVKLSVTLFTLVILRSMLASKSEILKRNKPGDFSKIMMLSGLMSL